MYLRVETQYASSAETLSEKDEDFGYMVLLVYVNTHKLRLNRV